MVNLPAFLKRNRFVLLLLIAFVLVDRLVAWWDPMTSSRRFYKNDFTKTLYHHGWSDSGRVFFGNSAVTGAYMEDKSRFPLVEMGLSYGKVTDLQGILQHHLYKIQDMLVLGIDIHTMLDKMTTDPTYQWLQNPFVPYIYAYRDYFRDSGEEAARNLYKGVIHFDTAQMFAYQPRWIDKELYFGHEKPEDMQKDWNRYQTNYGGMTLPDFQQNLNALDWVIRYTQEHHLIFKVVWMPYNRSFPKPPYLAALKAEVNRRLAAAHVPVLDVMDRYDPSDFHDLVHLNRETGAPLFTKEVDAWLLSSAKSSS